MVFLFFLVESLGGCSEIIQYSKGSFEGASYETLHRGGACLLLHQRYNCNLQKGQERGALNKECIAVIYCKLTILPVVLLFGTN